MGNFMKCIAFIFASLVSISALASPGETAKLISDFMPLLEETAAASDFEVPSVSCGNAYGGIICGAEIKIFDTVSHGSSQGGGEEICKEQYSYRGGDQFHTDCSNCAYAEYYGIKTCE
jgi:hypothetical protein